MFGEKQLDCGGTGQESGVRGRSGNLREYARDREKKEESLDEDLAARWPRTNLSALRSFSGTEPCEGFKFRSGTGTHPAFVYVLNLIQPDFTLGKDAHALRVAAHPRLPAYSTGALGGAARRACVVIYALRGRDDSARERRRGVRP